MTSYCPFIFEPLNKSVMHYSSLQAGVLRCSRSTKKQPSVPRKAPSWQGGTEGVLLVAVPCGMTEPLLIWERTAQPCRELRLAAASPIDVGAFSLRTVAEKKVEKFSSGIAEGWHGSVRRVLMLHRLPFNFGLFLSKYMLQHLFTQSCSAGSIPLLLTADGFTSFVTRFGCGGRKMRALRGELAAVPKLIMELMKHSTQVFWHVVDGLWDSNVFCVGTSAVKGTAWGGGKHMIQLPVLLQSDLRMNAQDGLTKGRMEFPLFVEESQCRNLVCGAAACLLVYSGALQHLTGVLWVALPLEWQYLVFVSVNSILFLQLCVQMAQNNMLVTHLSAAKCNLLQTSFPWE